MTLPLLLRALPLSPPAIREREHSVRWWWQRMKHLDQRVAEADAELSTSRKLQEQEQKTVRPLKAFDAHNQFAEIVRDAIVGDDYLR